MIKNILFYILLLVSAFVFNIFYYAWFSWFIFLVIAAVPIISLLISLPFMIKSAVNGFDISCNNKININEEVKISFNSANNKSLFCPRVKFVLRAENSFAGIKKKIKYIYSGDFENPVSLICKGLSSNCGKVEFKPKSCRIYDMLGIFFIPVKIKDGCNMLVMPTQKEPLSRLDMSTMPVLGYQKKPGGGFAEDYELRQYQHGDSLKNIHWKLSSKIDSLIVKEPCIPVYKKIAIKLSLCDNHDSNDDILARFCFVCRLVLHCGFSCFAYSDTQTSMFEISSENDIEGFLNLLFGRTEKSSVAVQLSDMMICSIDKDGEEVSEC